MRVVTTNIPRTENIGTGTVSEDTEVNGNTVPDGGVSRA
jgi:hypothetical protein